MNEAYQTAMRNLRIRCMAHKTEHGQYPGAMEVDEATWETLRAGIHASRDATHLNIPLLEDMQIQMISGNPDARSSMHMLIVRKKSE